MNRDDHKRFLKLLEQYRKAILQADNIRREHISSGPNPTPRAPVTSADFADRDKRIRDAELEEQRCKDELIKLYPV